MAEPIDERVSERDDPRLRVRMVDLVVSMTEAAGSNRRLAEAAEVSETTVRNFKRGAFPRDSSQMARRLDTWAASAVPDHPGVGARDSLQDLLERWQGAPASSTEQPTSTPGRRLALVVVVGAVVVAVVAVAVLVGWRTWGGGAGGGDDEQRTVAGVLVDPGLVLDDDNFCTWSLGEDPIPLVSVDPLVMRVDARCNFPAEIDPAKDAGSSVFDAPDNDTAAKVGVIRSGNTFVPLCFVEDADEVTDGSEVPNTSSTWIRSAAPEGYLPDINLGGGYTTEQLLTMGLTRCLAPG